MEKLMQLDFFFQILDLSQSVFTVVMKVVAAKLQMLMKMNQKHEPIVI